MTPTQKVPDVFWWFFSKIGHYSRMRWDVFYFYYEKKFRVVVSTIFHFHPYLGKMNPFWRSYFSKWVGSTTNLEFRVKKIKTTKKLGAFVTFWSRALPSRGVSPSLNKPAKDENGLNLQDTKLCPLGGMKIEVYTVMCVFSSVCWRLGSPKWIIGTNPLRNIYL